MTFRSCIRNLNKCVAACCCFLLFSFVSVTASPQTLTIDCSITPAVADTLRAHPTAREIHLLHFFSAPPAPVLQQLAVMKQLQALSVSGGRDLSGIMQLTQLQSLEIYDNPSTTLPEALCQLTQLKRLVVRRTHLSGLPACITRLDSLAYLNLSENKLAELPQDIGRMHRLGYLNVSANLLDSLPVSIAELHHLYYLDCSMTFIDKEPVVLSVLRNFHQEQYNRDLEDYQRRQHYEDSIWSRRIDSLKKVHAKNVQPPERIVLPEPQLFLLATYAATPGYPMYRVLPDGIRGNIHNDVLELDSADSRTIAALTRYHNLRTIVIHQYAGVQLPPELRWFPKLETLTIEHATQLDWSRTWDFLLGTVTLKNLSLNNCNISSLPETHVNAPLETLSLAHNTLRALPDCIGNMTTLKRLDISDNRLKRLPDALCRVTTLDEIRCVENHLRKIPRCLAGKISR